MRSDEVSGRLPVQTMLPPSPDETFDRVARLVRSVLGVPTALVSLVDQQRQVFPGAAGLAESLQLSRETPLTHSLCKYVVSTSAELIVDDARVEPLLAANGAVRDLGVIAYAGMPLTAADGTVVGSLCAIDAVARNWTQDQLADLRDLAATCSSELHLREVARMAIESSQRAETLLTTMPIGYVAFDADWRVTAVNPEGARISGKTAEELLGGVFWDLFPELVDSEFEKLYRRVASTGTTEAIESFYAPLDSWLEVRVRADQGGTSAYFTDVTSRRITEARSAHILATMPVGFIVMDQNWRIVSLNAVGAQLGGFTADELVGGVVWELFPALVGSDFEAAFRRVAETGVPEVLEAYYPPPLDTWYDVRFVANDGYLSYYFHDVSARHEVQALLEKQGEHDRSVAHALQQALLTELPAVPGLQLAARYLTATGTEQVGGDWYDAVIQPSGALTVSIGDVCGHGIEAAADMGQLRAMLRGFLWDDDRSAARGVQRLDRAMRGLDQDVMATLVVASIETSDSGTARLRWTNAGHPPPIVIRPDGTTETLERSPELMVGAALGVERTDHVHPLAPGSTLLLYTDGLIETRTESLAHGITLLRDALTRHAAREPGDLLDAVLTELRAAARDDDVAVLVLRIDAVASPADGDGYLVLESDLHAPSRARAHLKAHTTQLPAELVGYAEILVSELVTNAVLHGRPVVSMTVEVEPAGLTVTVRDGGDALSLPSTTAPDPDAFSGRGLPILTALASDWGVTPNPSDVGKAVWFRMESGPADAQPENTA